MEYNTDRPYQSLDMAIPADRFQPGRSMSGCRCDSGPRCRLLWYWPPRLRLACNLLGNCGAGPAPLAGEDEAVLPLDGPHRRIAWALFVAAGRLPPSVCRRALGPCGP
jgi:hypothetical protein